MIIPRSDIFTINRELLFRHSCLSMPLLYLQRLRFWASSQLLNHTCIHTHTHTHTHTHRAISKEDRNSFERDRGNNNTCILLLTWHVLFAPINSFNSLNTIHMIIQMTVYEKTQFHQLVWCLTLIGGRATNHT